MCDGLFEGGFELELELELERDLGCGERLVGGLAFLIFLGVEFPETEVVPVGFVALAEDGEASETEAVGAVVVLGGPLDAVGGAFLEESVGEGEVQDAEAGPSQDGDGGGVNADEFCPRWVGHRVDGWVE